MNHNKIVERFTGGDYQIPIVLMVFNDRDQIARHCVPLAYLVKHISTLWIIPPQEPLQVLQIICANDQAYQFEKHTFPREKNKGPYNESSSKGNPVPKQCSPFV